MLFGSFQECQERTETQKCPEIRDRETCLITNDPRVSHLDYYNYAGPCGWCGDKCGNENVCEPVAWLKRNHVTDFEDCLKEENTTTTIIKTTEGWFKIIISNLTIIFVNKRRGIQFSDNLNPWFFR